MDFESEVFQWPPLRLARVCFERVSVVVVCPAFFHRVVATVEEGT
jgi:hypothetical protein